MLNVDTKFLSKAISNNLKAVLSTLISSQQIPYVKNRFIGESGRLISDITEISGWFNIKDLIITMDIEKTFDSLDNIFLIFILKKIVLGENIVTWIEILLKDQQPCVINGRTITQYFKLERDACQGDPVLTQLVFILVFILFLLRNIQK